VSLRLLRRGAFLVGWVGRFEREDAYTKGKGLSLVIDAVKSLPGVSAFIGGWGESDRVKEVRQSIRGYDITLECNGVHTPSLYKTVDCIVLPFAMEEGGPPLTFLEACMAEKPVIVTPASDIPRLFPNGGPIIVDRTLSSIRDAIAHVRDMSGKERMELGKRTKRLAIQKGLTAAEMTAKYLEVMK